MRGGDMAGGGRGVIVKSVGRVVCVCVCVCNTKLVQVVMTVWC